MGRPAMKLLEGCLISLLVKLNPFKFFLKLFNFFFKTFLSSLYIHISHTEVTGLPHIMNACQGETSST